jgi:hypothetical protein
MATTAALALVGCETMSATSDVADGRFAEARAIDTILPAACDYPQAFGPPTHAGAACPEVRGMKVVATITQDPDAAAENEASGFLQVHEGPPLTSGNFVIVPSKEGFTTRSNRGTEHYHVQAFRWAPSVTSPDATLVPLWTTKTDWQPVDSIVGSLGSYTNGYVAQFGPAVAQRQRLPAGARRASSPSQPDEQCRDRDDRSARRHTVRWRCARDRGERDLDRRGRQPVLCRRCVSDDE